MINLAGPYAQRRYAPRSRWRSEVTPALTAANDFDNVTGLINAMHGTGRSPSLLALCRSESRSAGTRLLKAGDIRAFFILAKSCAGNRVRGSKLTAAAKLLTAMRPAGRGEHRQALPDAA